MIRLATDTINLIEAAVAADNGTAYKSFLQEILPKIEDAYREESGEHRSHLGASRIGRICDRELWYGFRWVLTPKFPPRILRLFNRGHLEEARFLALLLAAKITVWYETEDGGQFRLSDHGGHFGSALDSIVKGLPEIPNEAAYGEFKTHNDKSFKKLQKEGLAQSKPEHFKQMQVCMKKFDLKYGLYLAVNKNDDMLHGEIIELDNIIASDSLLRAKTIIFNPSAPQKISESSAWFECKWCDDKGICHGTDQPEINCRTCCHSDPLEAGGWHCGYHDSMLPKEIQLKGCSDHIYLPDLIPGAEHIGGDEKENYITLKIKDKEIKHGSNEIKSIELWNFLK